MDSDRVFGPFDRMPSPSAPAFCSHQGTASPTILARITNWWDTLEVETARWYLVYILGSVVVLCLGKFFLDLSHAALSVKKARERWNAQQ